ncbi:unnamed protein product [Peronospora destructor]|uniref:Nucleoside phosphorylase domain-containing protein n=1 Tax=Peronospora destructor TaxID=86335 RepID=A0AAV0VIE8_9STRA|nr:unnamed protein product [Peronospora destructor]
MDPNMDTVTTDSAALQVHKRQEMLNTFGGVKFFITDDSAERMMNFAHSVAMMLVCSVTKLLEYAGALDATYIRMGTSGGIGVEPGIVVITSEGVNNKMESVDEVAVLGLTELRPSIFSCNDFYEGQGRLDGATCEYTLEHKIAFLQKLASAGVLLTHEALHEFGKKRSAAMLLHYIKAKLSAV